MDKKELAEFEFNGTQYLFNLDPATGNLFYLTNVTFEDAPPNEAAGSDDVTSEKNQNTLTQILRYRVKSVKLDNTIGIEFDNNRMLLPGNPICVTGIKESHNFTIEWVEDSFFRVQKFHKEWISHWFQNKTLQDGLAGKFVSFTFEVFYLNNEGGISPTLSPKPAYTIKLDHCAPIDLSDFSFSYDEQDNGKSFVGKYVAKNIEIKDSNEGPNEDSALKYI